MDVRASDCGWFADAKRAASAGEKKEEKEKWF